MESEGNSSYKIGQKKISTSSTEDATVDLKFTNEIPLISNRDLVNIHMNATAGSNSHPMNEKMVVKIIRKQDQCCKTNKFGRIG